MELTTSDLKTEIGKDHELFPGDVVELNFNTPGGDWLKATEAAVVEYALEGRDEFEIITINYLQPGKIVVYVEVKETNPVVVTVALICGAIAVAALAFGWMFDKAYLVSKEAPAQALSIGVIIVLVAVAVMFLRR